MMSGLYFVNLQNNQLRRLNVASYNKSPFSVLKSVGVFFPGNKTHI